MLFRSTQISYGDFRGLNQRLDSKKRTSGGPSYDSFLLRSVTAKCVTGEGTASLRSVEDGGYLMESFMSRLWQALSSVPCLPNIHHPPIQLPNHELIN